MSTADLPPERYTLRQLPLAAKLVVSTFLLAVGLGYTSAMVQLHMGHSNKDGEALPTPADVVAIFAGKVWRTGNEPRMVSKLEELVNGPAEGKLTKLNMAPAFFAEDNADYEQLAQKDPAGAKARREAERKVVTAWINAPPAERKAAYEDDRFPLAEELAALPLTEKYLDQKVAKVKSILDARCARCHGPGGDKAGIPLTAYEHYEAIMPKTAAVPPGGGYVDSGRQVSLGALTQSTHAHLLSFATLFSLTGLIFAFTSYPGVVRGVVGPIVLIAQVADIACWWLARLPDSGPYFAMAILGTGGVVGMGLGAHIVLGLFNMYGLKGKAVLLALFVGAGAVGALGWKDVVQPHLNDEKAAAQKAKAQREEAEKKAKEDKEKKKASSPKPDEKKAVEVKKGAEGPAPSGPSRLEVLLVGPWKDAPWPSEKGKEVPAGGMVRAFFDKEGEFGKLLKKKSDELPALIPEREGEQAAVLLWLKSPADARKKAFEEDKFLAAELKGKPLTADYKLDEGGFKVRSLFEERCQKCHSDTDSVPLTKFDELDKYLRPTKAALAPAAAAPQPAAVATVPIPPARD